MKSISLRLLLLAVCLGAIATVTNAQAVSDKLEIVIIRHGEKPVKGDNLTCQGLNRSLMLPKVLYKKFGIPAYIYVPALLDSVTTLHARMFQTVTPFAVRYNLTIDSRFGGKEYDAIANDLKRKTGTVLLVWDHKAMAGIVEKLGVKESLQWPDNDYDSIWIISFAHGKASLRKDKEGLHPAAACPL
ncbi:MAG TPA: histidine phosphatase family protein [Chitinophagaceae bacterium]|jgi:hypothetical protein